jgi:hypothetical protein
MDVQGVFFSATFSLDVRGVSLSTTSSMDGQGISPSTASNMDVQGVQQEAPHWIALPRIQAKLPLWDSCTLMSYSAAFWATLHLLYLVTLHPLEVCCILLSNTLHGTELPGSLLSFTASFFWATAPSELCCTQRWAKWRLSSIDLYPGGEGHGVQGQICDILRPQLAMNFFLPLWPHKFPHFKYIHLGGAGGGGALILDQCPAFDLFASVDAHLWLHPTELRLLPIELCLYHTLLSYTAPLWATLPTLLSYAAPSQHCCTLLSHQPLYLATLHLTELRCTH